MYETPPAENNAIGSSKIVGLEIRDALQINSKSPAILYIDVKPPNLLNKSRLIMNEGKGTNVSLEIIELESLIVEAGTHV